MNQQCCVGYYFILPRCYILDLCLVTRVIEKNLWILHTDGEGNFIQKRKSFPLGFMDRGC
jgi:hypothetical protein